MPLRVGLMISTPDDTGQELLAGIVDYVRLHPQWSAGSSAWWNPRRPSDFKGFDGLIIRGPERFGKVVQMLTIPIVDVSCSYPMPPHIARVISDNVAVGRIAAEHFLQRGHRALVFVGRSTPLFAQHRRQGFREVAQAGGAELFEFVKPGLGGWSRESVAAPIRQWLRRLPRPMAILGDDDETARLVLEACRGVLHVPEEAAVLGVNNNQTLCELSTPALSSIDTGSQRVGYRAAALLDHLMSGHPAPSEPILIAPGELQLRRSSDVYAIRDSEVAKAMRYIQEHAIGGVSVREVCDHVLLSPRNLELRFRQAIGRSPREQAQLVRMQLARRLLGTGLSIATVAAQAGFSSQSRFGQMFRRETGMTPLAYRRALQEGKINPSSRPS